MFDLEILLEFTSFSEILESSLQTFDEGKELLARLREMNLYADSSERHATSSACHSIEHLLEILNDRRRYLEELWHQRKVKLEQCIQICYLKDEIRRVRSTWVHGLRWNLSHNDHYFSMNYQAMNWLNDIGLKYIEDARLGSSYVEATELHNAHNQFEREHNKVNFFSFLPNSEKRGSGQ